MSTSRLAICKHKSMLNKWSCTLQYWQTWVKSIWKAFPYYSLPFQQLGRLQSFAHIEKLSIFGPFSWRLGDISMMLPPIHVYSFISINQVSAQWLFGNHPRRPNEDPPSANQQGPVCNLAKMVTPCIASILHGRAPRSQISPLWK